MRTKSCFKFNVVVLLAFLTLSLQLVSAQEPQVTGTVTSADGQPFPFANVLVKGTSRGVSTDIDGKYSIQANGDETLSFSSIGFITQEIPIDGRSSLDVQFIEDIAALEEVIVVGYGTQSKKDLTSATSVVDPNQLQKRQSTTVAESLQGLASGVTVRGGGQPGQEARIEIRG